MPEYRPSPEARDVNSYDYWLNTEVKRKYIEQVTALNELGLLDILLEAEAKGVVGIDGREYPIPSWAEIKAEMEKNKEKYDTKRQQGFTGFQLTPIALPVERLTDTLTQQILKHHKEGKLFATKEHPDDPDEPLELDTNQPLLTWDGWLDPNAPAGERGADVTGKCVYYPKSFDEKNHQGQTKQEMLDAQVKNNSPFAGWKVLLIEETPNIPREGQGKTVGGRKQLETNRSSEQYLKTLQTDPQYRHEQCQTNEDWLTMFLIHLHKTNQVIDDYQGKGSICFNAGTFHPASRVLGYARWSRVLRQARLVGYDPGYQGSDAGLRSAVGLGV